MASPGDALRNDLFISYSHLDNRPWGAGQRQWVTELHHELETRLAMLVGRDIHVWRDDKIGGADVLDERIKKEVRSSRLFLCVMTPRYLQSEWCQREMELFLGEPGNVSDERWPFFKVIKTPIALLEQPNSVQRFLGFEFFREVSGRVHEFFPNRDENSVESREFWQKVDDLAQEMKTFLEPVAPRPRTKVVYLAEATADVRMARDGIRRELGQRGYHVVPDRSLPFNAEELLLAIKTDLETATLTVHPVGGRYGFIPENETRSVVELQIDFALKNNGHAQHLIWISPETAPDVDARQQDFLQRLRRVYTEQQGTELLERKPLEDLKTRLVEKLEPRLTVAPAIPQSGLRVYLVCDDGDWTAVKTIESMLRAAGCSVHLPLVEGTAAERRRDHKEMLNLCDAVLIYYGSARPAWLREKERDLWKAPGWGRTRPFAARAVCVGPPVSPDKQSYDSDEFLVIHADTSPEPDALRPFISQARNQSRGASDLV
jgi:hypothetical protein